MEQVTITEVNSYSVRLCLFYLYDSSSLQRFTAFRFFAHKGTKRTFRFLYGLRRTASSSLLRKLKPKKITLSQG